MNKLIVVLFLSMGIFAAPVEVKEVLSAQEFRDTILVSKRPVVVQFSAYWCKPCQRLLEEFKAVSFDYDETELSIIYVDAHVNMELRKYLGSGYPTVRTFYQNTEVYGVSFEGYRNEFFLRQFLDRAKEIK